MQQGKYFGRLFSAILDLGNRIADTKLERRFEFAVNRLDRIHCKCRLHLQ